MGRSVWGCFAAAVQEPKRPSCSRGRPSSTTGRPSRRPITSRLCATSACGATRMSSVPKRFAARWSPLTWLLTLVVIFAVVLAMVAVLFAPLGYVVTASRIVVRRMVARLLRFARFDAAMLDLCSARSDPAASSGSLGGSTAVLWVGSRPTPRTERIRCWSNWEAARNSCSHRTLRTHLSTSFSGTGLILMGSRRHESRRRPRSYNRRWRWGGQRDIRGGSYPPCRVQRAVNESSRPKPFSRGAA